MLSWPQDQIADGVDPFAALHVKSEGGHALGQRSAA
jgi:hypothetical protein